MLIWTFPNFGMNLFLKRLVFQRNLRNRKAKVLNCLTHGQNYIIVFFH